MESPPTTRHQRLMPGCSIICESTCIGLVAMIASPAIWLAVSVACPSPVHELKLHGELVGRLERRAVLRHGAKILAGPLQVLSAGVVIGAPGGAGYFPGGGSRSAAWREDTGRSTSSSVRGCSNWRPCRSG